MGVIVILVSFFGLCCFVQIGPKEIYKIVKVVDKRITKEHKHFAEIKIGDTFTKESSVCVFIKTQNVYEIDEWGYHELIVLPTIYNKILL